MKQNLAIWVVGAVLGAGLAGAQGTSPTVKDDLFNGTEKFAKGASDVTEVTMDPDTLEMVNGSNARRAHGMVLNVVRTYEYDKPGMYNIADVEQIRQRLNTGDWHCSVHTQDTKHGESTDICNKHRTDGLTEQAIITVEPKELTFIHTIKHADSHIDSHHENGPGESMLFAPEIPGLKGWDAASQARFASMAPILQARMAAIGPEMQARMAGLQARMAGLQVHLQDIRPSAATVPRVPAVPRPPRPSRELPAPPAAPELPQQL